MTTTLRPAGPEEHGPDGARSRRYTVCVNSRPVGAVELATDDRSGAGVGRVVSLEIAPKDRRRGRGTVAALAAEEVLRGWGCHQVEAAVPGDAAAALSLAAAVGYTERYRGMEKSLPGTPPELPAGSAVRPLADEAYETWHAKQRAGYIDSWVRRGAPYDQAVAKADADHARLLPDGPDTAHSALRVLVQDGQEAGWLWLRLRDPERPQAPAWIFSVEVGAEYRGHGHGRTLMLLAERECLAAGVHTLGLNVFAGNAPAIGLYASLGYRTTSVHLFKQLL